MNDVVVVFTQSAAPRVLPKEFRAQVKLPDCPPEYPYGQWDALVRLLDPRASQSMGVVVFSSKLPPSGFPIKGATFQLYAGQTLLGTAQVTS